MKKFLEIVRKAKEWATQMGYEGAQHRDEVRKIVEAELSQFA